MIARMPWIRLPFTGGAHRYADFLPDAHPLAVPGQQNRILTEQYPLQLSAEAILPQRA